MESKTALQRLSALAQEGRLDAFRRLMVAGPQGLAAGDLARALAVPANTLSAQLAILAAAGLVGSHREGRSIIYCADYEAVGGLLRFLMEDCCQGRAEVCGPLVELARFCCDRGAAE